MSQDNRLLPLSHSNLDRPLRELTQPERPNNTYALPAEPTHLRDYLAVVLKRKWLIVSLVVVVTSLVAIVMYRLPSIYEATTTIQIEQKSKNILKTKELVLNAANDPAYWGTQLKLLENPRLARKVILALDLQNNPAFLGAQSRTGLLTAARRLFSHAKSASAPTPEGGLKEADDTNDLTAQIDQQVDQLTPEQSAKLEQYEDALRANLTIEPEEKTNLVDLKFKHSDPELAAKVADTLAVVFINDNFQRETEGETSTSHQISKQIADLQLGIRQKQEQQLNFKKNHDLPLSDIEGSNLQGMILTTTSKQMLDAADARQKDQAAFEAARSAPDILAIPEVLEDKSIQGLRDRLSALEQQRSALLVQYTEEWPEVKKIDEQRNEVKQALDKRAKDVVAGIKSRYEAAVSRENKLRQANSQARGAANQQSQDALQLSNLNQELETDKQLYNTYLQRQKELEITANDTPNNISIATPARLPHEPIGPARGRNIFLAFLLSLGGGVGLAFLFDYLDDTLKSIEDVDRHVHLPTLALIPAPRAERRLLLGKGAPAPLHEGVEGTALALIDEVRSPVAEAYRHLRTSLLLSSAGQPPKTILITSSQPSEGKTTTAVNTAVMLAQTGAEVLILDCDLRRPRIHTHFNLPNTRGITNYLSGESDITALLQVYDKLPNLKIITSGPVPPNSAELLGSEEMRKLLLTLGENFTHIIIDSPPAISFTDASILSTMVDGVVLVVHGGRSSRAVVRRAKQILLDVGAHIYGIVLNNVKLESSDYNYYSGYYSSYYANDDDAAAGGAS